MKHDKDYIIDGFSDKAKQRIVSFDKIKEIWECGDVCFHDSIIKSISMSCDEIRVELIVEGKIKGETSDGYINIERYRMSILFSDICRISLTCDWVAQNGITFTYYASFYETDNGYLVFSSDMGEIWCNNIKIESVNIAEEEDS